MYGDYKENDSIFFTELTPSEVEMNAEIDEFIRRLLRLIKGKDESNEMKMVIKEMKGRASESSSFTNSFGRRLKQFTDEIASHSKRELGGLHSIANKCRDNGVIDQESLSRILSKKDTTNSTAPLSSSSSVLVSSTNGVDQSRRQQESGSSHSKLNETNDQAKQLELPELELPKVSVRQTTTTYPIEVSQQQEDEEEDLLNQKRKQQQLKQQRTEEIRLAEQKRAELEQEQLLKVQQEQEQQRREQVRLEEQKRAELKQEQLLKVQQEQEQQRREQVRSEEQKRVEHEQLLKIQQQEELQRVQQQQQIKLAEEQAKLAEKERIFRNQQHEAQISQRPPSSQSSQSTVAKDDKFQQILSQSIIEQVSNTSEKKSNSQKLKDVFSQQLADKLQNLYQRPYSNFQKIIRQVEEKIIKYSADIVENPSLREYGPRICKSTFLAMKHNYNVEGTIRKPHINSYSATRALYDKFESLCSMHPDRFRREFLPSEAFGVPKVRLVYITQNQVFNIALNDEVGRASSELIKAYRELDERVDQLITLVRLWADSHGFCNEEKGYLSSFAWENLVINILQVGPAKVIPSLQAECNDEDLFRKKVVTLVQKDYSSKGEPIFKDIVCDLRFVYNLKESKEAAKDGPKENLFSLFTRFFLFYSERYENNFANSISRGKVLVRKESSKNYLFSIQDPFIRDFDVGSTCIRDSSQADHIMQEMKRSFKMLSQGNLEVFGEKQDN